ALVVGLAAALAVSPWIPVALVVPGGYVVALVVGSVLIEPELAARSRALLPGVLAVMHLSWGVGFITSRVSEPA
ncbi:MAG: glycosyltransferase family 2 protein, partial [Actinomycetota bacterium]